MTFDPFRRPFFGMWLSRNVDCGSQIEETLVETLSDYP
jgi:hypothetical protein